MALNDNLGFNFGPTLGPIQIGGPDVFYKQEEPPPPPPPPPTGWGDPDEGFLEDDPWGDDWGGSGGKSGGKGKDDSGEFFFNPGGKKKDSQGREIIEPPRPPPPPPPPPQYEGGDFGDYDPEKGWVEVGGGSQGGGYFGGPRIGEAGDYIAPVKYRVPNPPGDPNVECPDFFRDRDKPYRLFDYDDRQDPDQWPRIWTCEDASHRDQIKQAWERIFSHEHFPPFAYNSIWAREFSKIVDLNGTSLWDCIENTRCPEIGCQNCGSGAVSKDTLVNYKASRHYPQAKYSGIGRSPIKPDEQVLYGICMDNLDNPFYSKLGWTNKQDILVHILLFMLIIRCTANAFHGKTIDLEDKILSDGAVFEALFLASLDKRGYGDFPWEAVNNLNFDEYLKFGSGKHSSYPGRRFGRFLSWDPVTGKFYNWNSEELIAQSDRWKF